MIVRKILLAVAASALMSTPAWGLSSHTPSNPGRGHAPKSTSNADNPGHSGDPRGKDRKGQSHPGSSHKCTPHKVGYVADGALVSETLTKNSDGSYSGEVVVEVARTNHHASADKGKTVTYTLTNARVTFGLSDTNNDGSVGLDDLAKGDRTHLIGRITALARKCDHSEFKATTTIHRVVFHAPEPPASKG
jgi:hypothetical protein